MPSYANITNLHHVDFLTFIILVQRRVSGEKMKQTSAKSKFMLV